MQIPLSDYTSDIITHDLIPTTDFRKLIQASDVIIDSKVLAQDGLTARFMWALGTEKKIITTNAAATEYSFYSPKQILILDENKPLNKQETLVRDFLSSHFEMDKDRRNLISNYRIDNWIQKLLEGKNDD